MKIQEIYRRYSIPPNLERHMLQVAAVGEYICTHWSGPELNSQLILQALLLHDLGNIVKFKRPFLGELEQEMRNVGKIFNSNLRKSTESARMEPPK